MTELRPAAARRRRDVAVITMLLLVTTCLLVQVSLARQDAPPQSAATATAPVAALDVSAELIQALIKRVEAATDIDEAIKTKILDQCRQALARLKDAESWLAKRVEFERRAKEAPAELERLKKELAEPPAEPELSIPADATLAQMEQQLAAAELESTEAQREDDAIRGEPAKRAERQIAIPKEDAKHRQFIDDFPRAINAPPPADEHPDLTNARRAAMRASFKATHRQREAAARELTYYGASGELLLRQQDLAKRRVDRARKLVKKWTDKINDTRQMQAQREAEKAEQARRDAANQHPAVRELANENAVLAKEREKLAEKLKGSTESGLAIDQQVAHWEQEFKSMRDKEAAVGLTDAIGLRLRQYRTELPDVRAIRHRTRELQREHSAVQLRVMELTEARSASSDFDARAAEILAHSAPTSNDLERRFITQAVKTLIQVQYEIQASLIGDYGKYFEALVGLVTKQTKLAQQTQSFTDYIDEHVLWIQSSAPVATVDLWNAAEAIKWLISPVNWLELGRGLIKDAKDHPAAWILAGLITLPLLLGHGRLRTHLRRLGERVGPIYTDRYAYTLVGLLLTIGLALPLPLVLGFVARRLATFEETSDLTRAVAAGLWRTACLLFAGLFVQQLCRRDGLGEAHFRWRINTLKIVRRNLSWLLAAGLPLVFLVAATQAQDFKTWRDSLGRLAFILAHAVLMVFLVRILRPGRGILDGLVNKTKNLWLYQLRFIWYPLLVVVPFVFAAMAAVGFDYTALQLEQRFQTTVWLLIGILILHALLVRWLYVAHRKLAVETARKRREAAQARAAAADAAETEAAPLVDEAAVDLSAINVQTRKLLRSLMLFTLALGFWFIWVDILPALGILNRVVLWNDIATVTQEVPRADGFPSVEVLEKTVPVTLAHLVLGFVIVVVSMVAARNIPGLLEITVLQRLPLHPSGRYAFTTISRYLISVIGIVIAFGAVGIGWSKVQWLAAALTLGLGFGLQEIFANFISGLIILFERPIRVGDVVTVGDVSGTVSRIRVRATTIIDFDRKDLIVPNKEFITGKVVNWTLTDPTVRLTISLGVAYGSDVELVQKLLLKVARENPNVLKEPEPFALFVGFGESTLDFNLFAFAQMEHLGKARNELNLAISVAFREAGIEFAFPHREIRLRLDEQPIPIVIKRSKERQPRTPTFQG